jgi:hypothetical protein
MIIGPPTDVSGNLGHVRWGLGPFGGSAVDLVVVVEGPGYGDELRSLYGWLVGEEELRGRVHLKESVPEPGRLGTLPLGLEIALAPGGGAVLASAVVAWLRYRTSDLTCRVTRPDGGAVEVSAKRVRDPASVRALVAELSDSLGENAAGVPGGAPSSGS